MSAPRDPLCARSSSRTSGRRATTSSSCSRAGTRRGGRRRRHADEARQALASPERVTSTSSSSTSSSAGGERDGARARALARARRPDAPLVRARDRLERARARGLRARRRWTTCSSRSARSASSTCLVASPSAGRGAGEPPRPPAHRRATKKSLVFLDADEVWAFEASHRLTFVHTPHGTFDLDLSLSAIEASFGRRLTRVHRNWLVNPTFVKELEREGSDTRLLVGAAVGQPGVHVPVARERAQELKDLLLANATGLRRG